MGLFWVFRKRKEEIVLKKCMACSLDISNEQEENRGMHYNCSMLNDEAYSNAKTKFNDVASAVRTLYGGLSKFKEIADKVVPVEFEKRVKEMQKEEERQRRSDFNLLKKEGLV